MPKFQQVVGDPDALRAVMADRINQAISRNPGLFRTDRGRQSDFATRYGLMRTVACRVLNGETFPSPCLLLALAEDTNLPLDWFYGRTEETSAADVVEMQPVSLPIFRAPGFSVSVPAPMLSVNNPEHLMLVRNGGLGSSSFVRTDDYLLVERTELLTSGAVYCVLSPGAEDPGLYRITKSLQDPQFFFKSPSDDHAMAIDGNSIVFKDDQLEDAPGKILVIGKVVGRLNFFPHGLSLDQI